VLTEAATNSKVDSPARTGNVIMGRLIPAGTGLEYYRHVKIAGEDVVEQEPIQDADLTIDALTGTTGRLVDCTRAG